MTPIERAIAAAGGEPALAAAIGKSRSVVAMWKARDKVAAEACPSIERVTREANGADPSKEIVTCEELRPDVEWSVVRANPAALAEKEG